MRLRFRNPHWQLDLVLEPDDKKVLTATTDTTVHTLDGDPAQALAGLDLLLEQRAAKPPQAQHLVFEGKPDDAGRVALKKPLPLPGFSPNLDDFPFAVTLAGDKADPPPAKGQRVRFRNPDWELELLIEPLGGGNGFRISDKSKITNVSPTQRTLALNGAVFYIEQVLPGQNRRKVLEFNVPEEWLAWKNTTEIKKASDPFVYDESTPIQVYQLYSWDTSPIKQIDAIQLPGEYSFNSHRTSNLVLKPATQFPVEAPKEASTTSGTGTGGPSGPGSAGMGSGGPMGGMGGSGPDTSKTPNGLVRNRYISVTEQVRHMPVAIKLVVDQAHMQDVLTAVVNSKLRIQITQVQWKRAQGIKSNIASDSGTGTGTGGGTTPPAGTGPGVGGGSGRSGAGPLSPGSRGGLGGMGTGGPMGGGPGAGGPAGMGGMGAMGSRGGQNTSGGGSGGATASAGEESDPNLVELAVYGIAALYERYPPRAPAKPDATGGTAAAGQPTAPASGGTTPATK
jgi:hypothetical protein